jgi:hypothetical protein
VTSKSFSVLSPAVNVSGAVVISVSGNNQQFINDLTMHFRDSQNTFEYYQPFLIQSVSPPFLSNSGNSQLKITGMQFDQFKWDNGTSKEVNLLCRFVDSTNNKNVIGAPSIMKKLS